MAKPVLFICGPYHGDDEVVRAERLGALADAALRYMHLGWETVIPQTMYDRGRSSAGGELLPEQRWRAAALNMALQCDAAFFLKGWRACPGAVGIAKALDEAGIPYWDRPELVPPAEGFEDWVRGRK
jgi:hypothetical protein